MPARFTLENYGTAYFSAETVRLFGNSVAFGVGSSAVAFVSGTFFAWVNERTNTPFKSLFFALSLIPLVIPAILFTVSWILLASPKIGIINFALRELFATDAVFVDIYSLGGMIFVDGMHQSPLAFLLMTAAFRAMDPALEESALMSGATVPQIARRVTLAGSPGRRRWRLFSSSSCAPWNRSRSRRCWGFRSGSRSIRRPSTRRSKDIRARSASLPPTPSRCS